MAKKNRSTLKRYFRKGALPSEDQFADLIDSSLNMIDEGFDRSAENGLEISLTGDHERLISFFRSSAERDPDWSISYDSEHDKLTINKVDAEQASSPAISFTANGRVGINNDAPRHELDVNGVISCSGRLGANPDGRKRVPADGNWHDITGVLTGCHAYEVMAGAGNTGTGRYAIMRAVAINTFNPSGFLFNFLNLKKRISYQHGYYLSRTNRIKLRWKTVDAGNGYTLQMRSNCNYGDGVAIRFYITNLWLDERMKESQLEDENGAANGGNGQQ